MSRQRTYNRRRQKHERRNWHSEKALARYHAKFGNVPGLWWQFKWKNLRRYYQPGMVYPSKLMCYVHDIPERIEDDPQDGGPMHARFLSVYASERYRK